MTRKPITEHLADLHEEYREEAIRLHKESGWANDEFELRSDALVNAFPFADLRWVDLYFKIQEQEYWDSYGDILTEQPL